MEEHYGDIHLHHGNYPGPATPGACDSSHNYFHGNQCGKTYTDDQPYDCHCNLCQPPYSLPYQAGPGGHLGGLTAMKPCGNPHCRCTDCTGNCHCGDTPVMAVPASTGSPLDMLFDWKYMMVFLGLVILAFYLLKKRRR